MADLLGSILGSMQKPPSVGTEEKRKVKEQRDRLKKEQDKDKQNKRDFHIQKEKEIHTFIEDASKQKMKFEAMDKVYRAILHEIAETAGLTSFSFGLEEDSRYVMIWKKEFAPCDEELQCLRDGKDWDLLRAKLLADAEMAKNAEHTDSKADSTPLYNYKEKNEHLIGREAAKNAAMSTVTHRSYGFVSSENKRDQRTIEQVMADCRARKKLKTDISQDSNQDQDLGT